MIFVSLSWFTVSCRGEFLRSWSNIEWTRVDSRWLSLAATVRILLDGTQADRGHGVRDHHKGSESADGSALFQDRIHQTPVDNPGSYSYSDYTAKEVTNFKYILSTPNEQTACKKKFPTFCRNPTQTKHGGFNTSSKVSSLRIPAMPSFGNLHLSEWGLATDWFLFDFGNQFTTSWPLGSSETLVFCLCVYSTCFVKYGEILS